MTRHQVIPAWARDFNNSKRHCYVNAKTGQLQVMAYPNDPCDGNHDPKLIGNVEWLRFIRTFGKVIPSCNPFAPLHLRDADRFFLLNEVDGHPTSDGRHTYCETYLEKKRDSWGVTPIFRVFLDNEAGWARIECYDEDLVGACEQALTEVEQSYGVTFA